MKKNKIFFKTGLAVMLAGFVVFVFGFTSSPGVVVYDGPPAETDSAILARHIHEVKVMYALEEFSDHSFNSHIDDAELDSILNEDKISVENAGCVYAPDSAFAIYYIEVISCGAYCNPMWESFLHFKGNPELVRNNAGFSHVDSIVKLPDGKYLIFESEWARPASYYTVSLRLATLMYYDAVSLKYFAIPYHSEENPENMSGHGSFVTMQHFTIDSLHYLQYDRRTRRLNFQYGTDFGLHSGNDSAIVTKGYFQYEDGQFVEKEISSSGYKVKDQ